MRKVHALVLAPLTLAACRSVATPDPTPDRTSPAVARAQDASAVVASRDAAAPAPVAAPEAPLPPLAWGTRPEGDGPLWPIVDGMCIHGKVFPLAKGDALFGYGMSEGVWSRGGTTTLVHVTETGLAPQADQGPGKALGWGSVLMIGGTWPDHLFAAMDTSGRMWTGGELRAGGATGDWKTLLDEGNQDPNDASKKDRVTYSLAKPIPLADGSFLVPRQTAVAPANGGEWKESWAFHQLLPDGTLAAKPKVPGADLAGAAREGKVAQLASGEIVGVPSKEGTKLIRWSPSKPVDDVVVAKTPTDLGLLVGKTHAWIRAGAALSVYDGERVTEVKAPALAPKASLALDEGDALLVVHPDGKLDRVSPDGAVTATSLPMPGSLVTGHGEAWLVSAGKGADKSDLIHRRTDKGWEPVPIPAPPFGHATRSKLTVEGITIAAKGDVFVNVRRVEKGLGWSKEEPYRAFYRTKKPAEVLRCQDVRHDSTGVGVWSWAKTADASCTTPVVTVLTEAGKPAKDYPNVAAKLRGKVSEYGEKLRLVNFTARGTTNLGIPMTEVAKAEALATYLSKSLDLRADVACGKPEAIRTLVLDLAKGTFSEEK